MEGDAGNLFYCDTEVDLLFRIVCHIHPIFCLGHFFVSRRASSLLGVVYVTVSLEPNMSDASASADFTQSVT